MEQHFAVQLKYTDEERTVRLNNTGFVSADKEGYQIFELLNLIPGEIYFKKTFIDWKKKKRFVPDISNMGNLFHANTWGYGLKLYNDRSKCDQAQIDNQLVNLLADMVLYIKENNILTPSKGAN